MSKRASLATAVPVVALLALVSTAALPGPRPPAPRALPALTTTSTTDAPLAAEVKKILTDLNAVDTDAGLVVPIPEQVLFDFNKADVRDDAKATLEQVAKVLTFYGGAKIEVRGHTDDVGDDAYNQVLSERRATAVRDHLVGVTGVSADRFVVKGFGKSQPIVPNDTPEHRQQNRRVEVVVLA